MTNGSGGSGYDGVGNVVNMTDSVMGRWQYGYDNLNRLTGTGFLGNVVYADLEGWPSCHM